MFRGGWDRAAAQAVTGATLAVVASLVDKSLIRRNADQRYDLHPLVQEYALAKLDTELGALEATAERHGSYYAAWIAAQLDPLLNREQRAGLTRLSHDIDNIRTAWYWAVAHDQLAAVERMAETLVAFFEMRDLSQEGDRLFAEAAHTLQTPGAAQHIATASESRRRVVGRLLAYSSYVIACLGDVEPLYQWMLLLLNFDYMLSKAR